MKSTDSVSPQGRGGRLFLTALRDSVPVLTGYLVLGTGFGMLLVQGVFG